MSNRRRLTVSAVVLMLALTGTMMLTGYYSRPASAAPLTANSFFTESYIGMTQGVKYLMSKLLGAPVSSPAFACTLTQQITVSGCYYTTGSKATVSVEVAWTGATSADTITVSLDGGAQTRTINPEDLFDPGSGTVVAGPIKSPQVVAFEIDADGASHSITSTAAGANSCTTGATNFIAPAGCAPNLCASGELGGTVFFDYDADGVKDSGETNGASGVTITAFDINGTSYTATSDGSGRYEFSAANGNSIPGGAYPVRLEFTNLPAISLNTTTPHGTNNASSVQFASAAACTYDVGVMDQTGFCQENPYVILPCYANGDPAPNVDANDAGDLDALVAFPYTASGGPTPGIMLHLATARQVGSLWGTAYNKFTKRLFSSAMLRRHVGLGPLGLGGIYVSDMTTPVSATTNNFIDVTTLGIDLGQASVPSVATRGLSRIKTNPSHDTTVFGLVGKVGIGDLDISEDGNTLWFVNLFDKKLYSIDISAYNGDGTTLPTGANVSSTTIPGPTCTNGVNRPWGTKVYQGKVYVGTVCDGSSGTTSDLRARVSVFNPVGATWNTAFEFPLTYPKGYAFNNLGDTPENTGWYRWTDDFAEFSNNLGAFGSSALVVHPQPILSDIEFDIDGSLVIGLGDRGGMQMGYFNYGPVSPSTTLYSTSVGGDVLRAFFSNGTYVLENNGKAGAATSIVGVNNNQGPGFGEFYDDNWTIASIKPHTEHSIGALAIKPGSGEVISVVVDPVNGTPNSAGVRWLDNSNGSVSQSYAVYASSQNNVDGLFGKAAGLGDVELNCDSVSYLEIGNRIWMDGDADGIQDPGEMPISGVTLRLYTPNGKDGVPGNSDDLLSIATAVTDSTGTYYFTSADANNDGIPDNDTNTSNNTGLVGGGTTNPTYPAIQPNTRYVIRADRAADFASGGALFGKNITQANIGAGALGSPADLRDSDGASANVLGIAGGNFPEIEVQHLVANVATNGTGAFGEDDHTMDMGFVALSCNVAGATTVCASSTNTYTVTTNPDPLTNPTYSWTISTAGGSNATITGAANGSSVMVNSGTNGGSYTVIVTITSVEGTTSCSATATVNNVSGGVIAADQTLCSPGDPAAFTVPTPATGAGTLTYQWQSSTTDCTTGFSNIGGALSATYDPPSGLTQTTYYRRITTSTLNSVACTATSNCVTVSVNNVTPGVVAGDQPVCSGGDPTAFTVPTAATGSGALTYQWESSTTNCSTGFSPIAGANSDTYDPPSGLTQTTYYRRIVTSTLNNQPCTATSNCITVTINAGVSANAGMDQELCLAVTPPTVFNLNGTGSGGNPSWSVFATTGTAGATITNGTTLTPTINVTGVGTVTMRLTVNSSANPSCGSATDDVVLTVSAMNLGNVVWKDLDNDGLRDTSPAEPVIDGVLLNLYRESNGTPGLQAPGDTFVTSQTTAGGGLYNFTGLPCADYYVQAAASNFTSGGTLFGCTSSTGSVTGNSDLNDRDHGVDSANPATNGIASSVITLALHGEPTNDGDGNDGNLTADFGFAPLMNLGNLVWKDLDADGVRDTVTPNEPGIDGVKVVLWLDNGDNTFNSGTDTMVTMQNTSGGGAYNFTGLLPGNYFVQIDSTNFGAGVLSTCLSSPGNENGDTVDNNDNGVDNPTPTTGGVVSVLIPLVGQGEPTNDGDGNNGNLTVDFGFYAPMNLGNLVWKDLDADGIRDTASPNEPGIDGVKVVLWRDNGDNTFNSGTDTMVTMQNTSGGGAYNFTNLLPGNYFVQIDSTNFGAGVLSTCLSSPGNDSGDATDNNDNGVDNPTPTTGGIVSVLIPLISQSEPTNDGDGNNGNLTADFGFYPPMNLGNLVWKDLDADGIRDTASPNEPGIDGVKVVLWQDNGDNTFNSATDTMVTMQNTSGGGAYNFTNLLPGNYFVQIDSTNFGAGVLSTCLSSPGNDSADLVDNNDNGVDNPTPTTGGVVSVLIPLVGQSEPTNDGDGNNGNLTVDFGFYPPMNLGNLVWKDLDGDGIRDTVSPNEPGVDGVKVVLWRDNGDNTFNAGTDTMVTMQNTSGGGAYNFTNLLPGNYFVQIDQSNFGAGVLSTCLSSPGNENGDATDNNDNGVDNLTPTIGGVVSVLIPLIGQSEPTNDGDGNNGNLTIDFGFYPPMNLGNLVWKDLDADGVRDTVSPNEPGIDGVKVVLWRDNGDNTFNAGTDTMVTMQNTSGGGAYNFTGLVPGNYFVQIDSTNFGAGVLSTCLSSPGNDSGDTTDNNDNGVDNPTPTTGGVLSVLIPLIGTTEPTDDGDGNNGNLTIDFGFYPPMNLGNLVWKDLDADGIRDTASPNEPGIDGVKVVLWRDNGDNTFSSTTDTMVTMQNTSGGGAYNFTNLLPGNYFVQIDSTNFGAGVLSTCLSSPGSDSGDATDNNDNGVDNPTPTVGGVVSVLIPLVGQSEPTNDGDGNNGNLTVDFGFYPPMNLGNLVWKDLDADGVRDTVSPNEPGIDGVKVVLWRDNGDNTFDAGTDTMVTMQNTSGGGAYNFTNLLPGNYFVQIDASNFGAGVLSTCLSSPGSDSGDTTDNNDNGVDNPTPTVGGVVSVLIPLVGQSEPTNDGDGNNGNLTVDFGFYPPMNLGNLVWKDLDADGVRDTSNPNEPGIDGVKVVLWRDNGDNTFNSATDTMTAMQNTSGGGAYSFTDLIPGNYFVQIDQSNFGAGVLSTCLSSPGNENGDATDNNDNGVDNQTPTIGGVVSVLIPLIGQSEPTNDGDGNNGNLTIDFGFYPPMNLGNLVWKDNNGNGLRDGSPQEPGVDGVKVVLWRDNGDNTFNAGTDTMVTMQNTSGGGAYNFTNLLPGNYFVQIDQSNFGAGVLSTCLSSPGNDSGDATDNNDNGVDNPTPTVGGVVSVLIPLIGQSEPTNDGDGNNGNLTIDFGFYPPMNLGNLVWKDLNFNGQRDVNPLEPGIDGVKVVLWRDNGDNTFNAGTDTMLTMQNTSGGGAYNFVNLLPGTYFVQIDASNFGAGVLGSCLSSTGADSGDTDNNDNGVDAPTPGTSGVVSTPVVLIGGSEPTNDGDGPNGNLSVDFGFIIPSDFAFGGAPGPNAVPGKVYEGDPCNGALGTYVITFRNDGPAPAIPGAVMTDVIPTGITPMSVTGSSGWNCSINGQTVSCTSTTNVPVGTVVRFRINVAIGYNIAGPVTNTASVAYPGDPINPNNSASVTINIVNGTGSPGQAFENNGSSVLVYPIYTSSASASNTQNTRINLTNINDQKSICVHLFFVDGASCSVADSIVCLTPNQTTSFLASDLDPGTTGYLVAVAIDCLGCPTNFNFLQGDEYVKFASGHRGNIVAEGAAALPGLPACDNTSVTAALNFNGVEYSRFGRTLAVSNFGSRADGNDTMLVLNRMGGNLGIGAATIGTLFGILYDDAEQAVSFSVTGACQLRSSLTNNFPRTTPRFETFIPAGRSGWMKVFSQQTDVALVGATINHNPNNGAAANAFNGAHNLHKLTLSNAGSFIVPVFPAQGCQ